MAQKIAIYEGEGSSLLGLRQLDALFLSGETFFQTDWNSTCSLFILPGGRDRPFHSTFRGAGNQKIRSFVERGGTYLGLCAGAYFACAAIEFNKGFPLEICEGRELSFFPGTAVGPVYGKGYGKGTFAYESEQGARAVRLKTPDDVFYAYYNGGCTFAGDLTGVRILARYADLPGEPPAVIECQIGSGRAILSGVHLEISLSALNEEDPFHRPLIPLLRSTDAKRRKFFQAILLPKTLPPIR